MKKIDEMTLDEYIKLGQKVENNEKCPYCKSDYIIQHMGEIFLCGECGATLVYNFNEMKWEEEVVQEEQKKKSDLSPID